MSVWLKSSEERVAIGDVKEKWVPNIEQMRRGPRTKNPSYVVTSSSLELEKDKQDEEELLKKNRQERMESQEETRAADTTKQGSPEVVIELQAD